MKVHISLQGSVKADAKAKRAVLERLRQDYGLKNVNEKRLERYGVVSGEVDESALPGLRSLDEVLAVEADESKEATGDT